ncbi:MAG: cobalamin-dependent protein, partial [Desulfuromonadales bacterium]|nr:cobalamin-dependent protein [Desulfuromonadales bacterium]
MRILLVNPPNCGKSIPEERYGIDSIKMIFRGEPLALETLAGNLLQHEVEILDLKVEPDSLTERIATFDPQIVGFTAMTCEANTVVKLASEVREASNAQIVVGGTHASATPEFFNRREIDWVVVGLGKQSFAELVTALDTKTSVNIPGIAATSPTTSLSWLPRKFSRKDLVNNLATRYDLVANYRPNYTLESLGLKMGLVATAAGCPYDCNFC